MPPSPAIPLVREGSVIRAIWMPIYGGIAYGTFLVSVLYAIGFVGDFAVPKTINSGPGAPLLQALVVDSLLLALFALQHSVMARRGFKDWLTRFIPEPVERSTYVLLSSLVLLLLFALWLPVRTVVWTVEDPALYNGLRVLFWGGWGVVLLSTFLIDHWSLFGLRQAVSAFRGEPLPSVSFQTPGLYRYVRHPIMLGFLLAFWSTPHMTVGHLLFAGLSTLYIVVGVTLEERDLVRQFGDTYRMYRRTAGMLVPWRPSHFTTNPPDGSDEDSP